MVTSSPAPLTAILLTYNEEKNVQPCLETVRGLYDELIVLDSGSTDRTVELCRLYTDRIFTHPFLDSATQWEWALANLPIQNAWVLPLDADHRLTPELREEIRRTLAAPAADVDGYYSRHSYLFQGVAMRGFKPYTLRLFRHGKTRLDHSEMVDFRFIVEGQTRKLSGRVDEDNRNESDIDFWVDKHQKFSTRTAVEEVLRRAGIVDWSVKPRLTGNHDERIMWLKQRWYSCPLFVRPFAYFTYRYFFRLGILDGRAGLIYHFMQAFWFRFMVDVKIHALRKQLSEGTLTIDGLVKEHRRKADPAVNQNALAASATGIPTCAS